MLIQSLTGLLQMGKRKDAREQNHPLAKISLQVLRPRNRTAGQPPVQLSAPGSHSLVSDFSCCEILLLVDRPFFHAMRPGSLIVHVRIIVPARHVDGTGGCDIVFARPSIFFCFA